MTEMRTLLASRLESRPVWATEAPPMNTFDEAPLCDDASRVALVLLQHVWGSDADSPDVWSWRIDRPNGRASSSLNLANEWVAVAALRASPLDAGCAP